MTHPHPPGAFGEARAPVSGRPRRERPRVLRPERAQALHRFGRGRSITRRSKLRVEAPKHFVAPGSLGVGELADTEQRVFGYLKSPSLADLFLRGAQRQGAEERDQHVIGVTKTAMC